MEKQTFEQLINKLKMFRELKPNWDSYGGEIIPDEVINKAINITEELAIYKVNFGWVFPGPNGNIQFEGDSDYNSIDMEIQKDLTVELTIYDRTNQNNIIEERKIVDEKDLLFIRDVLNLIINNIEYKIVKL